LDEVNRLKIIQDVIDRRLTTKMAAQRLGISDRQCRRLLARYREDGPLGMTSRRRGKSSNNQLPQGLAAYALSIIRERYNDFGPTLACEKLSEIHGVHLSKETVRKLMTQASLWVPRKQRAPKIQQPRYRRACAGELIQIDGCDHHWFENRGPKCTVLVYVDDATSRLMQLRFVKSESTFTYFEATRGYIEKHGKPLALYSDKASVFRINNKNATGGDGDTVWPCDARTEHSDHLCRNQRSKGRVERAHQTLQDRLVKELRLQGISTMEAANAFAEEFMNDYNRRFSKAPRQEFDVHREMDVDDDLDMVFTWREARRVSKSLTVQYDKVLYLIEDSEFSRRAIGKYIDVWHYPDGHKSSDLMAYHFPTHL
jgi:transposase